MKKAKPNIKISSEYLTNMCKKNGVLVNMSKFQQTVLAAETHLAEGLALKLRRADKVEKSLMDLEGMCKLTESKMEGQSLLHLNALIGKTASDASSSCGEERGLIQLECPHIYYE
jgi:hypothetical protein